MIFYQLGAKRIGKNGVETELELKNKINSSVFPGHQGGPHNHTITALAVALKLAQSSEFKEYQTQVLKNSKAMANALLSKGYFLKK